MPSSDAVPSSQRQWLHQLHALFHNVNQQFAREAPYENRVASKTPSQNAWPPVSTRSRQHRMRPQCRFEQKRRAVTDHSDSLLSHCPTPDNVPESCFIPSSLIRQNAVPRNSHPSCALNVEHRYSSSRDEGVPRDSIMVRRVSGASVLAIVEANPKKSHSHPGKGVADSLQDPYQSRLQCLKTVHIFIAAEIECDAYIVTLQQSEKQRQKLDETVTLLSDRLKEVESLRNAAEQREYRAIEQLETLKSHATELQSALAYQEAVGRKMKSIEEDHAKSTALINRLQDALTQSAEAKKNLELEIPALTLRIHTLTQDNDQLQQTVDALRNDRQDTSDTAIARANEAIVIAKQREKFLEEELAKTKQELNAVVVQLNQVKSKELHRDTPDGRTLTENTSETYPQQPIQSCDREIESSVPHSDSNGKDDGSHTVTMYQQALDEARKEVERFRQALGSQEHEVITLRYELRDALKTRGLAEQRFESLSSQTRYHQRMSPALQELKLVGASMQLPGATEPADMAPRPSVVAQFAHSRRSSDTRLLRDASLDAPSVVDNKKSSESIMTNAEAVTNGIGSNANPSNTFKEDYISTEVANKDSSASSETSSSSSQLSTDIHVLSSPFLPAGACGPSNPSAGATAAPTTSAKQRARVRKQTGIASHVDAQHRVSFLLNMEGSTSHSKDIGNILKKDVEEVQKTSPEATGPPLKKPNVSLEESSSVSEVPVKLPFSVGARSAQRKATGIVGQGFPKKFMPLKKKSLVLPSLTARSQPEEALDNGSYAAKNDQVQAQLKKLPGLKSPLVKFTKEDMMKKKLVAKKPPQRMIKESLSPNRMEQRQAAAVDVAVAEAAKPLPPLTRDLFPIYEDLEMRYLATDTQTRAKLFASLVKQLQSAQASMEQLLESGELLSRANERIVALTREMQQVRAHLRQTRIRCMDLQTLSARLREENRTLTIVITTVHDDLSTLLPTVSGSSESVLRRLWLLTAMRDTAATQPTNQLSKEWVYQRAASRTPPPRIAAALAVAAGRQSRSSISGVDAGRHTSLPAPAPSLTGSENQSVTFTTPLRSKQRPATSMENISPSQLALMRSERRALTAAQLQSLRSESLGETFDTLTAVTLPRRPSALGFNTTDRKDLKTRHSFMRALKPQRENGADSITPMTTANTPKPHTQQYSLNG